MVKHVLAGWVLPVLVVLLAPSADAEAALAAPPPVAEQCIEHAAPPRIAPVQLVDEITRRLRRMGINIIKTRIDHPYDPPGEVC